jgi:transposase
LAKKISTRDKAVELVKTNWAKQQYIEDGVKPSIEEVINDHKKTPDHFGLERDIGRLRRELKNLQHSLHSISCLFFRYWDIVLMPELGVKELLQSKSMGKGTKTTLSCMAHKTMLNRLKHMMDVGGKTLVIVSEAFSTQCCCFCGHLTSPGFSRVHSCSNKQCRKMVDRDVNAAYCILLFAVARIRIVSDSIKKEHLKGPSLGGNAFAV